jgi:hypothetical protein
MDVEQERESYSRDGDVAAGRCGIGAVFEDKDCGKYVGKRYALRCGLLIRHICTP